MSQKIYTSLKNQKQEKLKKENYNNRNYKGDITIEIYIKYKRIFYTTLDKHL